MIGQDLISEAWQHRRFLFVKALRETRDPDVADDMVAETYAKAFAKAATYRPDGKLAAWMYRILMNTIVDWQRSRIRRARLIDIVPIDAYDSFDHFTSIHTVDRRSVPWMEDPQKRQDAEFAAAMVWSCLHALPPIHRDPLQKLKEGKTYEEISEETGCCTATVRTRIFRARRRLGRLISERDC